MERGVRGGGGLERRAGDHTAHMSAGRSMGRGAAGRPALVVLRQGAHRTSSRVTSCRAHHSLRHASHATAASTHDGMSEVSCSYYDVRMRAAAAGVHGSMTSLLGASLLTNVTQMTKRNRIRKYGLRVTGYAISMYDDFLNYNRYIRLAGPSLTLSHAPAFTGVRSPMPARPAPNPQCPLPTNCTPNLL